MEECKLHVMTAGGWKPAQMRVVEEKIKAILITVHLVHNTVLSDLFKDIVLDSPTHTVQTLGVEVNRCCAVIFCRQTNKETKGQRYIVYGIPYNLDCDRGIGVTLGHYNPNNTLEHCPSDLHRDHIAI